jgi:hypothetical protein
MKNQVSGSEPKVEQGVGAKDNPLFAMCTCQHVKGMHWHRKPEGQVRVLIQECAAEGCLCRSYERSLAEPVAEVASAVPPAQASCNWQAEEDFKVMQAQLLRERESTKMLLDSLKPSAVPVDSEADMTDAKLDQELRSNGIDPVALNVDVLRRVALKVCDIYEDGGKPIPGRLIEALKSFANAKPRLSGTEVTDPAMLAAIEKNGWAVQGGDAETPSFDALKGILFPAEGSTTTQEANKRIEAAYRLRAEGEWRKAVDAVRDAVLNERFGLAEAGCDSDQINAVLGIIDDYGYPPEDLKGSKQ